MLPPKKFPPNIPNIPALPENPYNGTSAATSGLSGQSNTGIGVVGESIGPPGDPLLENGAGVPVADGVMGVGKNGVHGQSSLPTGCGVWGENFDTTVASLASLVPDGGAGVCGTSRTVFGVYGLSFGDGERDALTPYSGVFGQHSGAKGPGVFGFGNGGYGVRALSVENYGLFAQGGLGAACFAGDITIQGNIAAVKNITASGNITVSGDVTLTGGMDCAEQFEVHSAVAAEPGTVMVITGDGELEPSSRPYDKRAAGVVSGAGSFRPAVVFGKQASGRDHAVVALVGKVYCKVSADTNSIAVGDMLTTSAVVGHAMKVEDPQRAFGAVIGKALRPLESGRGLIPILVALQ